MRYLPSRRGRRRLAITLPIGEASRNRRGAPRTVAHDPTGFPPVGCEEAGTCPPLRSGPPPARGRSGDFSCEPGSLRPLHRRAARVGRAQVLLVVGACPPVDLALCFVLA